MKCQKPDSNEQVKDPSLFAIVICIVMALVHSQATTTPAALHMMELRGTTTRRKGTTTAPQFHRSQAAATTNSGLMELREATTSSALLKLRKTRATTRGTITTFHHRQFDLLELGAISYDDSHETLLNNMRILSEALQLLGTNSTIVVPRDHTFYLYNGIRVFYLENGILQVDGSLYFRRSYEPFKYNPVSDHKDKPPPCFVCKHCHNVTITSTSTSFRQRNDDDYNNNNGIINGGGSDWWGIPFLGYLRIKERRPFLLLFNASTHVYINHITLLNAPYYHINLDNVNTSIIHNVHIGSRRTEQIMEHTLVDFSAFNTDGIDVAGHDIYVHDVSIWTQDDCIAIKDNVHGDRVSSNMIFENINASGLGFVIGSISGTTVRNITFRNSYLFRPFKGIYMKFRIPKDKLYFGPSEITDIVYQNITMESPSQWPIWIGPAQQADSRNPCHANPCSICWPALPLQTCRAVPHAVYRNITLQDITIRNPQGSLGVILGDDDYLIYDLTFDSVRVEPPLHTTTITKQQEELLDLFPTLRYSVDDVVAQHFVSVVLGTVVAFGICLFLCCVRTILPVQGPSAANSTIQGTIMNDHDKDETATTKTRKVLKRKRRKRIKPSFTVVPHAHILRRIAAALTVLLFAFAIVFWHLLALIPQVSSPDRYFACQGVQNGIAKGSTFPIPSCFVDRTPTTIDDIDYDDHQKILQSPAFWDQTIRLSLLFVLLVVIYGFLMVRISNLIQRQSLSYNLVSPGSGPDLAGRNKDLESGLGSKLAKGKVSWDTTRRRKA